VRLNLLQEIKKNTELLVSSEVELAVIDLNGKVQKLPNMLLSKI
jgi:acyl-CoA thioesterase FadM